MAEKFNPFYKLLKTEVPINIKSELKEIFDSFNKVLSDAYDSALKQPIPGKQLVLMMDASFRSAAYALMVEDNPDDIRKYNRSGKRTPSWRLAPNSSPPRNSKCPYTQTNFWQSIWHFSSLHTFCGKQQSQQLS